MQHTHATHQIHRDRKVGRTISIFQRRKRGNKKWYFCGRKCFYITHFLFSWFLTCCVIWKDDVLPFLWFFFWIFLRIGKHVMTYLVQIHVLLRFLFPPFSSRRAWHQPKKERMKSDLFGLKPTETKLKHQINVVFFYCILFSFFSFFLGGHDIRFVGSEAYGNETKIHHHFQPPKGIWMHTCESGFMYIYMYILKKNYAYIQSNM